MTSPPLKISVITPNFNGADFLAQTIESVVSQGYPNLEYILVDGASTDGSMDIVRQHARHFAHVISEPDSGHANALNKGFQRATGDVLCWINSDDLLVPGSLARVNDAFSRYPGVDWLTGQRLTAREDGSLNTPHPLRSWSWVRFLCGDYRHIQQESTFWRRSLWLAAGGRLDERLQLANDFDLWLRFFRHAPVHTLDAPLGCFRTRSGQRSVSQYAAYERECAAALEAFVRELPPTLLARYAHLVPPTQWASRLERPRDLPQAALARLDPPMLALDTPPGRPVALGPNPLPLPVPDGVGAAQDEDLLFDGLDRVVWQDGPDFAHEDLVALALDIVPFVPQAKVAPGMSDHSPPMPGVIGPVVLTDWGSGRLTLQLRMAASSPSHDLQLPEAGRRYRLTLALTEGRYLLLLDGATVAQGEVDTALVAAAPRAVLGGGFANRFWVGALERLEITTKRRGAADDTGVTRVLSHAEGIRRLSRERRGSVPLVPEHPRELALRPSPLAAWRNRHRGQRCFVMGNGPSLNKTDLHKLQGEIVFACNAAFLLFDRVAWRPTYYACVDTRVVRDRADDITRMLDEHPGITAFFPALLQLHDGSGTRFAGRDVITPGPNRHYFHEVGNRESHHPETMFSLDADAHVVQPYTVAITMLQLAVYMGFSEIYLIGCDTSYKVQETVQQAGRAIDGVGLLLTSTEDDDANHFDPRYFGRGREWHNPQVGQMLNHYRWARLAGRRAGSRIRNATVGGQLEVFERVAFDSLFPAAAPRPLAPLSPARPLLSIAIPAYGRPGPLMHALERFAAQITGRFEDEVEIVVSDDCTPGDALRPVREFAARHGFMRFRRYNANIGLEKNLLACADICSGEYLWLFGDDDYLESDDALERVLALLREGRHEMLVLNRTRRNTALTEFLSPNWMGLDPTLLRPFDGLTPFCLEFGYLSVLGFISVNIFRRRLFQQVDASRYLGTMYPQLGAMMEAFQHRPVLLVGAPLVCHRTQTMDEKRAALGNKAGEAAFMSDMRLRNATFFSHPHVAMLDELMVRGVFTPAQVMATQENTVVEGALVDFLIDCVGLSDEMGVDVTGSQWRRSAAFFERLPLDPARRQRLDDVLSRKAALLKPPVALTISAVTPSFNQAEFLHDCLRSVRDQTVTALEHLVFDPGSNDRSREIAAGYPHVTLCAEADKGQSDALNKGFMRIRGDIICWLNSDDLLADDKVFERVIDRFNGPDAPDIVYGKGIYIDEAGKKLRDVHINKRPETLHWRFAQEDGILQPALFMRRSVIDRVGLLRDDLHFSMDYEYWIRCVKAGMRFAYLDVNLAVARYHISNKTYGQRGSSYGEVCRMMKEHFGYVSHHWLQRYAEFLAEGHDGVLAHGQNAGIRDREVLKQHYVRLLREHDGTPETIKTLLQRQHEPGCSETLQELAAQGLVNLPTLEPTLMPDTDDGAPPRRQVLHGRAVKPVGNAGCWQFTRGAQASERIWADVHFGAVPSEYTGGLRLKASHPTRLRFTLGRHGSTPWEGQGTTIRLAAGEPTDIHLRQGFTQCHEGIKLQVEVTDEVPQTGLELQIEAAFLAETVSGLVSRLPVAQLGLCHAHRLIEQRSGLAAVGICLMLRRRYGLTLLDASLAEAAALAGMPNDTKLADMEAWLG